MSDWKKAVLPAVGIVATVVSFLVGSELRTRQDTGLHVRKVPQSYMAGIESNPESTVNVPEGEMFYQLLLLLERDYVDPKINETKLAYGAVKGMVDGLWDPLSQFMQKDQYEEHVRRKSGKFGGIGVELRTVSDSKELAKVQRGERPSDPLMLRPVLIVATVVPGSPAELAGLQAGDQVTGLNNKWLLGYTDIIQIRKLQKDVAAGKMNADEFSKFRADFQRKAKSAISLSRAEDLLLMGEGRLLDLTWSRNGKTYSASVTTQSTTVPMVTKSPAGTYRLHLFKGVEKAMDEFLDATGTVVLDLRQSSLGDAQTIRPVLEKLAPARQFGKIVSDRPGQPRTLATTNGTSSERRFKLLVDKSTRGAAEIMAMALKACGTAEIVGGPMASEAVWIESTRLPDGSGYALNTGRFEPDPFKESK